MYEHPTSGERELKFPEAPVEARQLEQGLPRVIPTVSVILHLSRCRYHAVTLLDFFVMIGEPR